MLYLRQISHNPVLRCRLNRKRVYQIATSFPGKGFSRNLGGHQYTNIKQGENSRSVMKQIRIKTMEKYDGEFSDINRDF